MAKILIPLPKQFHCSTTTEVRITDINYAGHLGNDKVLSIIHDARMRFFNHFGYSEDDVEGVNTIMNNAAIQYKSQGYFGDRLHIEMAASNFHPYGFDVVYKLTNKATGKEIARATTGIVFFNYENNSMRFIPAKFKQIFKNSGARSTK